MIVAQLPLEAFTSRELIYVIDKCMRYSMRENCPVEDVSRQGAFPSPLSASYTVIVRLDLGRGRLGDTVCSCPNWGRGRWLFFNL